MDSVVDRPKKLFIRSKRHSPETVLVEIRDSGVGLKDPEKVFEAFFTTKENGMGMGLAVCRSIIDAHHGRLWAASGEGAGHHLLIYSSGSAAARHHELRQPLSSSWWMTTYRVREALSSLISSAGFRVALSSVRLRNSWNLKSRMLPACLVLDLQLPGTSGLELQQQLLAGDAPPIIFISGHGDIPSSVRAMKAGAIEFLSKPFDEQELLRAIDAAIALDRTAREKRSELAELQRHYNLLTPSRTRSSSLRGRGLRQQGDCRRSGNQ